MVELWSHWRLPERCGGRTLVCCGRGCPCIRHLQWSRKSRTLVSSGNSNWILHNAIRQHGDGDVVKNGIRVMSSANSCRSRVVWVRMNRRSLPGSCTLTANQAHPSIVARNRNSAGVKRTKVSRAHASTTVYGAERASSSVGEKSHTYDIPLWHPWALNDRVWNTSNEFKRISMINDVIPATHGQTYPNRSERRYWRLCGADLVEL